MIQKLSLDRWFGGIIAGVTAVGAALLWLLDLLGAVDAACVIAGRASGECGIASSLGFLLSPPPWFISGSLVVGLGVLVYGEHKRFRAYANEARESLAADIQKGIADSEVIGKIKVGQGEIEASIANVRLELARETDALRAWCWALAIKVRTMDLFREAKLVAKLPYTAEKMAILQGIARSIGSSLEGDFHQEYMAWDSGDRMSRLVHERDGGPPYDPAAHFTKLVELVSDWSYRIDRDVQERALPFGLGGW